MQPRVILTDIEGTTSSISFVKDVLFPYARAMVAQLVTQGGFPQMLLPPGNFEVLYARSLAEAQQQAQLNS